MVSLNAFVAFLSLSATLASAEYLAVIEATTQVLLGGTGAGAARCQDMAKLYTIQAFDSHPGSVGSGCSWKGRHVATSRGDNGERMEGCHGGYTNGWGVCTTSYGGNVHNGRGRHQRCNHDSSTLLNCPSPICYQSRIRRLKCDGVWRDD
jgi:hypothetical protein